MNKIRIAVCAVGAILLAMSDLFINMSSAYIIGSTEVSRLSAQLVAAGVVIGLMAMGSIAAVTETKIDDLGVRFIALVIALFSGALTVQAMSIDYATNDHVGKNSAAQVARNDDKVDQYRRELKTLESKMKECERDNYFKPCHGTEKRIAALSDKISSVYDDSVKAEKASDVDITYAIEMKSGLDGPTLEKTMIYSRAIGVPLMIFVLMSGFWRFLEQELKKSRAA